jgi:hypothetical protein
MRIHLLPINGTRNDNLGHLTCKLSSRHYSYDGDQIKVLRVHNLVQFLFNHLTHFSLFKSRHLVDKALSCGGIL